jgi:xanthine/CO dehydrogenase XdhC/CoxF family maturation factor
MIHELKEQLSEYQNARESGLRCVMATLVALEGSSYRKPGVFMLLFSDGTMCGAISGGCVEKEILKQSGSVFSDGIPKMMTYDGRYRLGCDGVLYILIEPFDPGVDFIHAFHSPWEARESIQLHHAFTRELGACKGMGTTVRMGSKWFAVGNAVDETSYDIETFRQMLKPCFRLMLIGAEHDARVLCESGALLGWEVIVVTSASDPQKKDDFPGVDIFLQEEPEVLSPDWVTEETAVVLMTHSYARDLKYLLVLKETRPAYLGMLGPARRREKLLNEFTEYFEEVIDDFLDAIYGPAGLDIGSETPREIALSVCAEILALHRGRKTNSLRDKTLPVRKE